MENCNNKINIKKLLFLTIPIFFELILQILLGNIDKIMVRNDNTANAITQANSILDMLIVSISVLSAGSLILINQYKGAKKQNKELKIYSIAFYFNILISLIIGIILLLFGKQFLILMNVNNDYINEAAIYLKLNGGFLFLQAIILSTGAFLRSNDMVLHTFIVSTLFNLLNVCLNALFLYVIKIEPIIAVGVATVISKIFGAITLLIIFFKRTSIKLSIKDGLFTKKSDLKKLLKISIPSAGETLSYSLSQIVILAIINIIGYKLTSAAPTAKTYTNIMIQFSSIFTSSISQAMQILLGRYLGAKDIKLAEKVVNLTLIISIISSIIIATIQALFAKFIFGLFTNDINVIKLCIQIMWIDVILEIGRATNIVLVRALQTNGDVLFPTLLAVFSCWVIAITGCYLLGIVFKLGMIGIWISMTIDELFRGIIFIIRFKKGKWKTKSLINQDKKELVVQ